MWKSILNLFSSLFSKKEKTNDSNVSSNAEKAKEKVVEKKTEPVDWALKITVVRKILNECDTIGDLYVSYPEDPETLNFVCNTLEDKVRNKKGTKKEEFVKVYGETAIPAGKYNVIITRSPKYKKDLPLLLDVPGFGGIRIHSGNTEKDSEGCIIVGKNDKVGWVSNSRATMNKLMSILKTADKITIEIF